MKAYNTQWSVNDFIQNAAQKWFQRGSLKQEQYSAIKQEYNSDYNNPNIFLKIGLFVFTILAASFSGGLLSLFLLIPFEGNYNLGMILQSLFLGTAFVFVLEFLIKNNKLYHSGVDNALIYMALGAFCAAIFLIFQNAKLPTWLILSFFLPFYIFTSIRYADVLVTISTYLLSLSIVVLISLEFAWGKILLPFIVMIFSIIAYFFHKKMTKRDDYLYYEKCLDIFKILALVTLYLGGNYLIVREGNARINNIYDVSPQIAFAPMFYFFTAIIPIFYIFFGLKNRDRLLLVIGLLATGFSIFTYRFYFSILPVEIALTLGGVLLIALAGLCIHYLRNPKYGITSEPDNERKGLNLESIIMSQVIQSKIPQQGDTFQFGGGDAGGGGAGGEY
jgi:uncharacterized membrane protein YgcG